MGDAQVPVGALAIGDDVSPDEPRAVAGSRIMGGAEKQQIIIPPTPITLLGASRLALWALVTAMCGAITDRRAIGAVDTPNSTRAYSGI